jgi:hypothetical protein
MRRTHTQPHTTRNAPTRTQQAIAAADAADAEEAAFSSCAREDEDEDFEEAPKKKTKAKAKGKGKAKAKAKAKPKKKAAPTAKGKANGSRNGYPPKGVEGRRSGSTDVWVLYDSQVKAAKACKIDPSAVSRCVHGKCDSASGWMFRFADPKLRPADACYEEVAAPIKAPNVKPPPRAPRVQRTPSQQAMVDARQSRLKTLFPQVR